MFNHAVTNTIYPFTTGWDLNWRVRGSRIYILLPYQGTSIGWTLLTSTRGVGVLSLTKQWSCLWNKVTRKFESEWKSSIGFCQLYHAWNSRALALVRCKINIHWHGHIYCIITQKPITKCESLTWPSPHPNYTPWWRICNISNLLIVQVAYTLYIALLTFCMWMYM